MTPAALRAVPEKGGDFDRPPHGMAPSYHPGRPGNSILVHCFVCLLVWVSCSPSLSLGCLKQWWWAGCPCIFASGQLHETVPPRRADTGELADHRCVKMTTLFWADVTDK